MSLPTFSICLYICVLFNNEHREQLSNNDYLLFCFHLGKLTSKKQAPCSVKIKSIHIEPSEPNTYVFNGDRYWKISSEDINEKYCNRTVEPNRIGSGSRWQENFLTDFDEGFKLSYGFWETFFFKVRNEFNDPFS